MLLELESSDKLEKCGHLIILDFVLYILRGVHVAQNLLESGLLLSFFCLVSLGISWS